MYMLRVISAVLIASRPGVDDDARDLRPAEVGLVLPLVAVLLVLSLLARGDHRPLASAALRPTPSPRRSAE